MRTHVTRSAIRFASATAGLSMLALALMLACGCADDTQGAGESPAGEAAFDYATLSWEPEKLVDSMPALVGWVQPSGVGPGRLIVLSPDGSGTVLWESPDPKRAWVQIEEVDAYGLQMVGIVSQGLPDGVNDQELIFRSDGSAEPLPIPEGFEGIIDVAFMGGDVLVVAYHATPDDFTTVVGAVDADGTWQELTLTGDAPEYQFVESLAVLPGSNVVGVVLKTPGGTGNRDDDALVLARRNGSELQVISAAYRDDSLAGCTPLTDGQGVAFGRTWSDDDPGASAYVRAEWNGAEWIETVLVTSQIAAVPLEVGDVIAQDSSGSFLIRRATGSDDDASSELLRVRSGGSAVEETGIDLTGVTWFSWLEAPER